MTSGTTGAALELPAVGAALTLDVGPIASGGHCVARHDGLVVFIRHALPGERVVAEVTEHGRGFVRADAVEVLAAAPDRVAAPCRYAGPGGCGGCDFQHVEANAQRALKAEVIKEQLVRLADRGDLDVSVEPLPGGMLGWRTRVQYAVDPSGRLGLRRHRSHSVVPVAECAIAAPEIAGLGLDRRSWPAGAQVEVARGSVGEPAVLVRQPVGGRSGRAAGGRAGRAGGPKTVTQLVSGPQSVTQTVGGRIWELPVEGFWQVHPAAAETLVSAVVDMLGPEPGERVWDLYAGAGLFAAAMAERVAERVARPGSAKAGQVIAVESSRPSVLAGQRALADHPEVRMVVADVAAALAGRGPGAAELCGAEVDLVVVDPPRAGLGAGTCARIAERLPRAIGYVSCDPATFARDVATFAGCGYRLVRLRAFDAFPMTHHAEVVGLLLPIG